jgi:hypothetical protein
LPELLFVAAILIILTLWLIPNWQAARSQGLTPENRFDRENEARKTLAHIIGGVSVLAGVYSSLQTFSLQQHTLALQQNTFDLQRSGQITDRFTKAIDQLGAVETGPDGKPKINLEVRLGGIYALERIAHDSLPDHRGTFYVCSRNSPVPAYLAKTARGERPRPVTTYPVPDANSQPRADIQAILRVIGRSDVTHHATDRSVNLSRVNLDGAYLRRVNLYEVSLVWGLSKAELFHADLTLARLVGADLANADLEEANLSSADVEGANLGGAKLKGAFLFATNLDGADLEGANLEGRTSAGRTSVRRISGAHEDWTKYN